MNRQVEVAKDSSRGRLGPAMRKASETIPEPIKPEQLEECRIRIR